MRVVTVDDPVLADRPDLSAGDQPAHARIAQWLEQLIVSGALQPGDRLPAEVEVAQALGVSRMTLRQALAGIEASGLIDRRRGRFGGNFVAAPRFELNHEGLPGFTEQVRRMRMAAGADVLRTLTRRPGAGVRDALGLTAAAKVHEIVRARTVAGEPILLEEAYFPAAVFPGLLAADLGGSLYALMGEYGAAPHHAEEFIEATRAADGHARLLGIAAGDPVLLITRTSYAVDGRAVEFSRDLLRGDRTRVRITSRAAGTSVAGVVPVP